MDDEDLYCKFEVVVLFNFFLPSSTKISIHSDARPFRTHHRAWVVSRRETSRRRPAAFVDAGRSRREVAEASAHGCLASRVPNTLYGGGWIGAKPLSPPLNEPCLAAGFVRVHLPRCVTRNHGISIRPGGRGAGLLLVLLLLLLRFSRGSQRAPRKAARAAAPPRRGGQRRHRRAAAQLDDGAFEREPDVDRNDDDDRVDGLATQPCFARPCERIVCGTPSSGQGAARCVERGGAGRELGSRRGIRVGGSGPLGPKEASSSKGRPCRASRGGRPWQGQGRDRSQGWQDYAKEGALRGEEP